MKLKDALENYYFHSGKTSDLVRQLALAGIAVIWLFKYEVTGVPKVPAQLLLPLGLIVCGLALDLLQYLVTTVIWGFIHRDKERKGLGEDADFLVSPKVNWLALFCFWLKVASICAAYCLLLQYLARTVLPQ
jgi:hypothetical protein